MKMNNYEEVVQDTTQKIADRLHDNMVGLQIRRRNLATNKQWGETIKQECWRALLDYASVPTHHGFDIVFLDMPYNTPTVGKGLGQNLLTEEQSFSGFGNKKVYCLTDILDGTWGVVSGTEFSATTMLAFTYPTEKPKEELELQDFYLGAILPHHQKGWYRGTLDEPPLYIPYGYPLMSTELRLSRETDPTKVRFILDLFTTQTYQQLEKAYDAVKPVVMQWADFARFYGAGAEISAMFGRGNIEPSIGAYLAANQKMDNIIPTWMMINQAGGQVSDWWGRPIANRKLEDRVYIMMAANRELYNNLLSHLSKSPIIEEGPGYE